MRDARHALLDIEVQFFDQALALGLAALELQTQNTVAVTHSDSFVAAHAVNVENDKGVQRGRVGALDACTASRKVDNGAIHRRRFSRNEQLAAE
jgi:hypothetical protein